MIVALTAFEHPFDRAALRSVASRHMPSFLLLKSLPLGTLTTSLGSCDAQACLQTVWSSTAAWP